MIKLEIKKDTEKVKQLVSLLKLAAASGETGVKAREAIAAFVGPVITQVLDQEATHRAFFTKFTYTLGSDHPIRLL